MLTMRLSASGFPLASRWRRAATTSCEGRKIKVDGDEGWSRDARSPWPYSWRFLPCSKLEPSSCPPCCWPSDANGVKSLPGSFRKKLPSIQLTSFLPTWSCIGDTIGSALYIWILRRLVGDIASEATFEELKRESETREENWSFEMRLASSGVTSKCSESVEGGVQEFVGGRLRKGTFMKAVLPSSVSYTSLPSNRRLWTPHTKQQHP